MMVSGFLSSSSERITEALRWMSPMQLSSADPVRSAIETAASGERELAIPSACVLPDGLQRVFFLRDPNDKDKVRRIEADLGVDDGRFVVVKSGLADELEAEGFAHV
jgi:hypothetical protein